MGAELIFHKNWFCFSFGPGPLVAQADLKLSCTPKGDLDFLILPSAGITGTTIHDTIFF